MQDNVMYVYLCIVQALQTALRYDSVLNMQSIAETVKSAAGIKANEIDTVLYSRLINTKGETRKPVNGCREHFILK